MSKDSDAASGSDAPVQDRKLNQRQCLLCRDRGDKDAMLRLVVDDAGQIWPDLLQKAPGRGSYLCMAPACLGQLSDKRLGMLRKNFNVQWPQCSKLIERLESVLRQQLLRLFSQYRAVAVVGRDAVMHQMWKNGPLLVLLAVDAGEAVVRQIEDASGKRQESGGKTEVLDNFSADFLAEALGREKISVAAIDTNAVSAKLPGFCHWYRRASELQAKVSKAAG